MLQLIIAILLGLAYPSYSNVNNSSANSSTTTNCSCEEGSDDCTDGTGGQTGHNPPPKP